MPDRFDSLLRFETGREFSIPLNGWATGGVKIGDPDKAIEISDEELTLAIQESRNGNLVESEIPSDLILKDRMDELLSGPAGD